MTKEVDGMLTILYTPHATSVDNEAKRASGHADVALSVVGLEQAQRRAQHFAPEPVDAVFASNLQRAAETARIAFEGRNVPIALDARLRECDYGDLTQFPVERIDVEFPLRIHDPFPNGESVMMCVARVGAFLREALAEYDGKTVVVIGHKVTRYALRYWSSDEPIGTIVSAEWAWKDVPIWRYEVSAEGMARR